MKCVLQHVFLQLLEDSGVEFITVVFNPRKKLYLFSVLTTADFSV